MEKKRKGWLLMLSGSNGGITGSILATPCPLLAPGRTFRWTSASSCVPAFTRCRTPGCTTPGLAKGFVTPVVWFAVGFSFRPWDKPMNNCVFFEIQTFDLNVSFSFVGGAGTCPSQVRSSEAKATSVPACVVGTRELEFC